MIQKLCKKEKEKEKEKKRKEKKRKVGGTKMDNSRELEIHLKLL